MRKLNTSDAFAAVRIIRASGMREELVALIKRVSASKDESPAKVVGFEGFLVVMEALGEKKAEAAVYELLAGPFEMPAEEIAVMDLDVLVDQLKELVELNNLKSFFNFVSSILGKN